MGFLILIIGIICIAVFLNSGKKSSSPAVTPLDLSEPTVAALAEEIVDTVNDMLDVRRCPGLLGLYDYDGLLMLHPHPHPPSFTTYSISIRMVNSLNWLDYTDEARKRVHPKYYEWIDQAETFARKYGSCYDPSEKSYVYITHCTVNLPAKNENAKINLMTLLREQIQHNCPLADFSGVGENYFNSASIIMHTKDVAH